MKISIIIPAHNEESGIATSLEAALAQDYPDFEVIVVDNASTDKTSEIISRYPVILVKEKRKGLPFAREAGRLVARGEILANMDADCLPESDWLARGAKYFLDEKVVAAAGPYDYYDANKFFRISNIIYYNCILIPLNKILQRLHLSGYLSGGSTFIRASAMEKVGGYDTSIKFWGEDQRTAKMLSRVGKLIYTSDLVVKSAYRSREGVFPFYKYTVNTIKMIFSK